MITDAFEPREYHAGETIIKQGDNGDNFYIIETGTMSVMVDGKKVKELSPKESFGELALLFNSPRAASVVCDSDATVFALNRKIFRHTLANMSHLNYGTVLRSLESVPLLKDLAPWQKEKIAQSVQPVHFSEGDVIIQKGEAGNIFYIIAEGVVTCTDQGSGMSALDLTKGMYFGEIALMKDEPRKATVTAKTDVQLMALDREGFNELLGPLRDALDHELGVRVLNSISFLTSLTSKERDRVIQACSIDYFIGGTQILKEGEVGDTFYIIKKGEVTVWTTDEAGARAEVAKLSQGEYFGEMALLDADSRRKNNVEARGADGVECFVMKRREFEQLLGPVRELLAAKSKVHKAELEKVSTPKGGTKKSVSLAKRLSSKKETKPKEDAALISFNDLQMKRTLGTGTFGQVKLVVHKKTGTAMALKIMQKAQVVAYKQETNVMNEKNIMAQCDNPFILKVHTVVMLRVSTSCVCWESACGCVRDYGIA